MTPIFRRLAVLCLVAGVPSADWLAKAAPALPADASPASTEVLLGEPVLNQPVSPNGEAPLLTPLTPEAPPAPAPFRLQLAPLRAGDSLLPPAQIPAAATLSTAAHIKVRKFKFKGNRLFATRALHKVVAPYEGRQISMEELEEARQAVTLHYVNAGFVNSGALLEEQPLKDGDITLTVVEGRLSQINLSGNRWFRSWWLRNEVRQFAGRPLNEPRLREGLQLLRQNPNIRQVNAELVPGGKPGEAVLELSVKERQPFRFSLEYNNARPPSVGSQGLVIQAADVNLTGHDDPLVVSWGLLRGDGTQYEFSGADNLNGSYTFPLTPWGTSLELRAGRNDSVILEEAFAKLDITSETEEYSATLHQSLYRSLHWDIALSGGFERKMNDTFLLQRAFSLSPGAVDGETEVDVLRFGFEITNRTTAQVIALRSVFNWGLDAFDATLNDGGTGVRPTPDGRYFTWVGQAQYVRRLGEKGLLAVARVNAQLSDSPLLSLEQFPVGGVNSVRGYRENTLLRDNGVFASLELRIPVWQRGKDDDRRTLLTVVPFFDYGTGWRHVGDSELDDANDHDTLTSVGIGVLFDPIPQVHAQLFWGYALNRDFVIKTDRDLQDYGFHFSISVTAF